MKIQKQINFNSTIYNYIADDTRNIQNDTLFIKTKQNKDYAKDIKNFIEPKDLKQFFSLSPKIIGITGTNGKTTTAAIIYSLLLDLGYKCALLGTRGFFINDKEIKPKSLTTPSLLELYENIDIASSLDCDFFIMEVSSHAIEQERIAGLEFYAKILTNITSDHLDYHKTIEEYIRVKNSFFNDDALKIINRDEKKALFNPKNAYGYGVESKTNLSVNAYCVKDGISGHILWRDYDKNTEEALLESNLYGVHNLYNILAAICCVKLVSKEDLSKITSCLENFGGVSGRMEVVSFKPLIIVDFAHTEDGMKQIFESFKGRKISVVFGAGGDRDKSKRPKMAECACKYAKKIYITSDNPRTEDPNKIINDIIKGIPSDIHASLNLEPDRAKAIQKAIKDQEIDEVLLVLGKGDETYQIIGNNQIHFDDREVIKEYLNKK